MSGNSKPVEAAVLQAGAFHGEKVHGFQASWLVPEQATAALAVGELQLVMDLGGSKYSADVTVEPNSGSRAPLDFSIAMLRGEFEKALQAANGYVSEDGSNPNAEFMRADVLLSLKRPNDAVVAVNSGLAKWRAANSGKELPMWIQRLRSAANRALIPAKT